MRIIAAVTLIFLPGTFTAVNQLPHLLAWFVLTWLGALRSKLFRLYCKRAFIGGLIMDLAILGDNNWINSNCPPRLADCVEKS